MNRVSEFAPAFGVRVLEHRFLSWSQDAGEPMAKAAMNRTHSKRWRACFNLSWVTGSKAWEISKSLSP